MAQIPQYLSILTLGTYNLEEIRAFYVRWGWEETSGSEEDWCAFDVGGVLLSFYSMTDLAAEAIAQPREPQSWGGFTLAINVDTETGLQEVFNAAAAAGATVVAEPVERDWGGISGYIADPDGNRWELGTGGPNAAGSVS